MDWKNTGFLREAADATMVKDVSFRRQALSLEKHRE